MLPATTFRASVVASGIVTLFIAVLVGHFTMCRPASTAIITLTSLLSAGFWALSAWLAMESRRAQSWNRRPYITRSEWANFFAAVLTAAVVLVQSENTACRQGLAQSWPARTIARI
jgi:hypothetical protein